MSRAVRGARRRPGAASRAALLVLVVGQLTACRKGADPAPSVSGPAERIAALSPAIVEMLFAVGCGDRVVLRDRSSDYPASVRRLPATNAFEPSAEHIAGFRPNLVIASHLDPMRARALEAVGLRVVVFDPRTVDGVLGDIVRVGSLCGAEPAARKLVRRLRRRIEAVQRRVLGRAEPSVYVELDGSDSLKPWTIGRASFIDDLLRRAGGSNVFGHLPRAALQVSAEAVLRAAPDVIVLNVPAARAAMAHRALVNRPAWARVPAVAQGRVVSSIDQALLTRPGPRFVEGLIQLARLLHPE